ncbi:MAG: ATP-binding protein [Bdellovibrionales bacterium]|nr:ATP-binding protein [Bdellovibrionales bacterium]
MMKRLAEEHLWAWFNKPHRAPLIIRGARQVGKSTLVRLFCERYGFELIEFNLEKGRLRSTKSENFDLHELLDEVQLRAQKRITGKTILFFDEIQEDPALLSRLRYFLEERPDIAVIAAGSLLEITIHSENFSFPVGRVEFYHLGPMTFSEFLHATQNDILLEKLQALDFSETVVSLCMDELRKYYYVGGMPRAVRTYAESKSLVDVRDIQEQIIQTYVADFPKYNSRINLARVERVFHACAHTLGSKVIYQKLDPDSKSRDIKRVVELLIDARVLLRCTHSAANQSPLKGECDLSVYKLYFLDIGLVNALLRLDLDTLDREFKNGFSTKGYLAEQFVAQHLVSINGNTVPPELFYWLRDKSAHKGEIDFLVQTQHGGNVVPIEVKAQKGGRLKSLIHFMHEKKWNVAVKVSTEPFSLTPFKSAVDRDPVTFELLHLPLFAIEFLQTALKKYSF